MKIVTIYQDGLEPITIEDYDDNRDIEEYQKELTNIMKSGQIVLLKASSKSVLLRPNKLISIIVEEQNKEVEIKSDSKKEEIEEDYITDDEE